MAELNKKSVSELADQLDVQRKKLDFLMDVIASCYDLSLSKNGSYGLFCLVREITDRLGEVEGALRSGSRQAIEIKAA